MKIRGLLKHQLAATGKQRAKAMILTSRSIYFFWFFTAPLYVEASLYALFTEVLSSEESIKKSWTRFEPKSVPRFALRERCSVFPGGSLPSEWDIKI